MKKTTILIAEDHRLIRETMRTFLSQFSDLEVLDTCNNIPNCLEQIKRYKPAILLLDINLEGACSLDSIPAMLQQSSETKILVVSMNKQPSYAKRALKVGGYGYMTKNSAPEELIDAIHEIVMGGKYICREIKEELAKEVLSSDGSAKRSIPLSAREKEVISYISKGLISKEIAELMAISARTVEVHRYNILRKLSLKNVAALVNFVHSAGAN